MTLTTKQKDEMYADALHAAITEPGTLAKALTSFHQYSFGNQLLALGQAHERGLELSPISTYKKWKGLGRIVKKGQKALWLTIPMLVQTEDKDTGEKTPRTFFVMKPRFFLASQTEATDGSDWRTMETDDVPEWDRLRAWKALDITEEPYALLDGNCGGYAMDRTLAVNPLHPHPLRIYFHEAAHIVLGHTSEGQRQTEDRTPRNIRELEAELTSYLCCSAVGAEAGAEQSRGYVQWWYDQQAVPADSVKRIFKATDAIIKAGREQQ